MVTQVCQVMHCWLNFISMLKFIREHLNGKRLRCISTVYLAGPYSLAGNVLDPFKTNNENSSEIIFSIPYDEDNFQGFRLHMRTLHYQHNLKYDMPVGTLEWFCHCSRPFRCL